MRQCILLVELVPDAAMRSKRAIAYPFLMGLSRAIGWRAHWRAVGVRWAPALLYSLPPQDLETLLREVKRLAPRVVIVNERLSRKQWAAVAAAAPGGRLVYWDLGESLFQLGETFIRLVPEARCDALEDPCLLDTIEPDYSRRMLNKAPWAAEQIIEIVAGSRCAYHAPLDRNPFYRRLRSRPAVMGCSFCMRDDPRSALWNVRDTVAFAVRQIAALCRRRPTPGVEKHLSLCGFELWRRLPELVRSLARQGVRGVELNLMPRLDEVLKARGAIGRCLPLMAKRGMTLRINGLGVENFSPDENLRLNKGLTAEQVHEATAFLIKTNRRWPEHFRLPYGGLGMILFTPWTRLEDLRVNLDHIERCPLIDRPFALSRRLMLFRDRPITLLAQRDGLLAKAGESIFYNAGCKVALDQDELPWRFAHPEIGILWQLARRLSSDRYNLPEDDPARRLAEAFIRESPPGPFDPLPLFREAIGLVERQPGLKSAVALLGMLRRDRALSQGHG
ncbi:MAG: hypothetical protein HZB91_03940 [Elusimicrobia bacterium]|nr:hypothetical protein [Elusimicrobiota bacterium]